MRSRHLLPVRADERPERAMGLLRAALDGTGPALLAVPVGPSAAAVLAAARTDQPVDDGIALLLPTSGSTGAPKVVELTAAALTASAAATAARLGGVGSWLLAMTLGHVAGWQVLVRSVVAGTQPVATDLSAGFTPSAFRRAAGDLDRAGRRYTSLVPTQLHRLLDDAEAVDALGGLDAVLLGGAPAPPALLRRAQAAGVSVRTTYGMTETCGGCVYDGEPLDGVRVRLAGRRVLLAGPVIARGYRSDAALTAASFVDGWFRTSDAGELDGEGRLRVLGRLDDVLLSGGVNVDPHAIEQVLTEQAGVQAAVVVGVPDAEWGQLAVALVEVAAGDVADPVELRAAVADALGAHSAPRHVLVVESLPVHGIGKPDRVAAARLARERLA